MPIAPGSVELISGYQSLASTVRAEVRKGKQELSYLSHLIPRCIREPFVSALRLRPWPISFDLAGVACCNAGVLGRRRRPRQERQKMKIRPTYLDNEFRQVFRNLSVPDRTLGINPEQWVKYCKRNGATTVFMDFRSQFYANHDSQYIPKDPVLGDRDLAAEFATAARKHGLKYCAYIPACCVESLEHGHDDWQQRTADGGKECRNWGFWHTIFCYNTGFGQLYADHLREVAQKYKVHGFYIDGVIYGFGACYCETCKAKFREETGQEMPVKPDWSSKLWYQYIDWRYRQVAAIGKLIGEAVHAVDPKIAVVWNCAFFATGWFAGATPAQAEWMDFAGVELLPTGMWGGMFQNGYSYAEDLAWAMSLNRALRYGQWSQHYSYFTPLTRRAEILTTANVACAFGAQGCPQEHCSHLGDYLGRIKAVEPWLIDSVSAADVALHYSVLAQNAYYRPDSMDDLPRAQVDVRGVYKALLNSHRPAEVITDEWLEQEPLAPFRAILLPNSVCLTAKATAALQTYVQQGGTVIATLETGRRDAMGRPVGDELLWKGSGLMFGGPLEVLPVTYATWSENKLPVVEADVSANPDQFLMFGTKAAMKDWIGEDITLGKRPDGFERREIHQFLETPSVHVSTKAVQVLPDASWKTLLPMKFRRDKAVGFETCPGVLVKKLGKGRIVYVNFQVGAQAAGSNSMTGTAPAHPWWRAFVRHLVDVAAGAPAVDVAAPVCVKTALWKQPALSRYVLHLVNELSSVSVGNIQREDLIPVPASVTITLPGVKKVKVVIGGRGAKVKRAGRGWRVDLSRIEERAVIECRCD